MDHDHMHETKGTSPSPSIKWVVGTIFVVLGGYYLWMQHRAHVLQYWPVAIFLLCPFMHFFHGHGGHSDHESQKKGDGKEEGEHHG